MSDAALVKAKSAVNGLAMTTDKFVEASIKSKLFKDTTDAQAYVKIAYGASLGLDAATSMTGLNIIQGKVTMSAALMAARINTCGYGRIEVLEKTADKTRIQFHRLIDDWTPMEKLIKKWIKPGPVEEFTVAMATKAGLMKNQVWQQYPMNMTWSRCISNGFRFYFSELMGGAPVYTPEELDPTAKYKATAEGDIVPDAEYTVSSTPKAVFNPAPSVRDVVAPDTLSLIRTLMAETGTVDRDFLITLVGKEAVEKLTPAEADKVLSTLKQKKAAMPF